MPTPPRPAAPIAPDANPFAWHGGIPCPAACEPGNDRVYRPASAYALAAIPADMVCDTCKGRGYVPAPIAPVTAAPTPGPAAPGPYTYDRADGIFDANGHRIARTSYASGRGCSMRVDDDVKEATVALLAAAPALRDALAALLASLHRQLPDAWSTFTAAEDTARALLASRPGGTDGR
jgi:hypothetical protein